MISEENSGFSLKLEVSENIKHSDRMFRFSEDEIVLDNTLFEEALSILLEKDTSLIYFQNEEGKDLMLKAMYNNYRENVTVRESKAELLNELKENLNFSLIEEIPENTYQLTIYDTLFLEENRSEELNTDKSTVFTSSGKKELRFTNANIIQIIGGINKLYGSNFILTTNMNESERYSFEIKNVPFEDLKIYLEKNIGLSLVKYNEPGFTAALENATKVVFHE